MVTDGDEPPFPYTSGNNQPIEEKKKYTKEDRKFEGYEKQKYANEAEEFEGYGADSTPEQGQSLDWSDCLFLIIWPQDQIVLGDKIIFLIGKSIDLFIQ